MLLVTMMILIKRNGNNNDFRDFIDFNDFDAVVLDCISMGANVGSSFESFFWNFPELFSEFEETILFLATDADDFKLT